MAEDDDTGSNEQKAVAKGKGSLAINAARYANVTVYQYVTYSGDRVTIRETTDPSRCPYPGLETFRTSEAAFFAGREDDVAELEAKLRDHDICGVIAASGAGKSSLVHAGLIPALAARETEAWDIFAFKPGQEPLYGLARSLSGVLAEAETRKGQFDEIDATVADLRETPGRLKRYIEDIISRRADAADGKHHHVLIFIDQWEELYTRENDQDRDILVRELMDVAERGLAKVLLTMRIDFMEEMLLLSTDFFRSLKPGIHYVEPMGETGLRSAIEVPAGEVGLGVPEALTSRLIADLGSGRDHGSLPYLQFVLRQLWENRDQTTNSLTTEAYDEMKGLQGAIGAHADAVFGRLTKEEQALAQRVLPRLANVSEVGAITSRRLPFADFDEPARDLLRKLAEPKRRLIVLSSATEEVAEAEIVAEVAHEALLDDWRTLSGWITDRKDFFRLRNKLEADAKTWVENDKNPEFLIPAGKPLLDAEDLIAKALTGDISKNLKEFVDRSVSKKRDDDEAKRQAEADQFNSLQRRNRGLIGLTVFFLFATLGAGYFWNQSTIAKNDAEKQTTIAVAAEARAQRNLETAQEQTEIAERRSALLAAENSYQLVERGETDRALLLLLDGAKSYDEGSLPDELLVAMHNAIQRAHREQVFSIPINAQVFPGETGFLYHDPRDSVVYHFDGSGAPRPLVKTETPEPVLAFIRDGFLVIGREGELDYYSIDDGSILPLPVDDLVDVFEATSSLHHDWKNWEQHSEDTTDTNHLYSNFFSDTPLGTLFLNQRNELVLDREVSDRLKESEVFTSDTRAASFSGDCGTHEMPEEVARSVASTPSYGDLGCRRTPLGYLHTVTMGGSAGTFNYDYAYRKEHGGWKCQQFWGQDVDLWEAELGDHAITANNNVLTLYEVFWDSFDEPYSDDTEANEFICAEQLRENGDKSFAFPAPIFVARYVLPAKTEGAPRVLVALPSLGEVRALDPNFFSPGLAYFNTDTPQTGASSQEVSADASQAAAIPVCSHTMEDTGFHEVTYGSLSIIVEKSVNQEFLESEISKITVRQLERDEVFLVPQTAIDFLNSQSWLNRCVFVEEHRANFFFQDGNKVIEVDFGSAAGAVETIIEYPLGVVIGISSATSQIASYNVTGVWVATHSDGRVAESRRVFQNDKPILSASTDTLFRNIVVNMYEAGNVSAALISIEAQQPWREFDDCYKHCDLSYSGGGRYFWGGGIEGFEFSIPSSSEAIFWANRLLSPHCKGFTDRDFLSSPCY